MTSSADTTPAPKGYAIPDDWTPQQQIPADLRLNNLRRHGIDEVRIDCKSLDAHRLAMIAIGAAVLGLIAYALHSGIMTAGTLAVAILTTGMLALCSQSNQRWRISIKSGELSIDRWYWWSLAPRSSRIPFSSIECIFVQPRTPRRSAIAIETPASTLLICNGLSNQSLTWLKNYLTMEIACLTWRPISVDSKKRTGTDCGTSNPILVKPELAVRLISIFLDQAPDVLEKLKTAVDQDDAEGIRRHAHWLKSASANVGAHRLSELCQLMEMHAHDNDLSHASLLCREIEMMLPGIESWLRSIEINAAEVLVSGPVRLTATKPPEDNQSIGAALIEAKILVADDSSVCREIANEYLSEIVTRIEFAADGYQAIEMWRTGNFDLIFMDCEMLPLDGFEAVERIREEEQERGLPRTPIVALTGQVLQEYRDRCFAVGMDGYIGKPYPPETLQSAVEKWVGTRGTIPVMQGDRLQPAGRVSGDLVN